MKTVKYSQKLLMVWMSLAVTIAGTLTPTGQAIAASFEPPPGSGSPTSTAGGGSRSIQSACLPNSVTADSLIALAPNQQRGLTSDTRPTVWVYVPKTTAQALEFSLFDEKRNGIYQLTLPLNSIGLMKIPLPSMAPALTQNQLYYWTVALVCNPNRRTEDWIAGGWIEYQLPDKRLQRQLASATALEQVSLYAQSGFWYDALDGLVQLRQAQPEDASLAAIWTTLLRSAGLDVIGTPSRENQASR